MKVKAVCKIHPGSPVYLLEGTVSYWNEDGEPSTESSDRSAWIELDEANLYCSEDWSDHDLTFEVSK